MVRNTKRMSSSGKPMSDNNMPGKGMGDKMSGMGSPTDPAPSTDPAKMPGDM